MHAHIVVAHPEPKSFNSHLVDIVKASLQESDCTVTVSDLYSMNFDPSEKADFYVNPQNNSRFDVQAEQRYASEQQTIPQDIKEEIEKLDLADILILQYPMWWHMPPAMLKGWFDRVLLYGEIYTSKNRFEAGRFKGKRAMLSVTVGTSRETYSYNGRSGDIDLMLWPVNFTLAYVGYSVLEPFVAYGVESAIAYSDPAKAKNQLLNIELDLAKRMKELDKANEIQFNKMAHWGDDGRITPSSPVYSAFIRHKPVLDLE